MVLVFVAVAAAAFPAKFIADDQRPESGKWNPPQCNTTGYTFNCCDQLDFTVTIPFEGPSLFLLYLLILPQIFHPL